MCWHDALSTSLGNLRAAYRSGELRQQLLHHRAIQCQQLRCGLPWANGPADIAPPALARPLHPRHRSNACSMGSNLGRCISQCRLSFLHPACHTCSANGVSVLQRPTLSCSAASNPGPRPIAGHAVATAMRIIWLFNSLLHMCMLLLTSQARPRAALCCSAALTANAKPLKQPVTHAVHSCFCEAHDVTPCRRGLKCGCRSNHLCGGVCMCKGWALGAA